MILQIQDVVGGILAAASPYMIMFVFGLLVGSLAPTYYAGEKLRGFGRAMMDKLPYKPPPGKETEEALLQATEEDPEKEEQKQTNDQ